MGQFIAQSRCCCRLHPYRNPSKCYRSQMDYVESDCSLHHRMGLDHLGSKPRYAHRCSCLNRYCWWCFLRCFTCVHRRNCSKRDKRDTRVIFPAHGYNWHSVRVCGWCRRKRVCAEYHLRAASFDLWSCFLLHARWVRLKFVFNYTCIKCLEFSYP